jgi:hypothetical protein
MRTRGPVLPPVLLQNVINQFTRTAQDPRVHFLGNVLVGRDVSVAELQQLYDVVSSASVALAPLARVCLSARLRAPAGSIHIRRCVCVVGRAGRAGVRRRERPQTEHPRRGEQRCAPRGCARSAVTNS